MAEQVELDVVLDDDFTGPAKNISGAADKLTSRLDRFARRSNLNAKTFQRQWGVAGRNTRGTLDRLGDSFVGVAGRSRLLRRGFTLAAAGMQDFRRLAGSRALGQLSSWFDFAESSIMGVGRALLNIGKRAVIGFGIASAAAAGFFTAAIFRAEVMRNRAILAFQAMSGNGRAAFQDLKRLAFETGSTVEDAFEGMQAFMRAGFAKSDAERWFKRMQDLSLVGVTAETRKRIVLAMSQIKGAGKLQGDELRQLQETGLDVSEVWRQIAGRMGISVQEAMKLKDAGEVGADVALEGIEAAVKKLTGGGEAGEAREKFLSESLGGAIERLKSLWSLALNDIAEAAGPAFKVINSILEDVANAFQNASAVEWAGTMGDAFNTLATWMRVAWSISKQVGAGFQEFMDEGALENINRLLEGMKVSMDIEDTADMWRAAGRLIGTMALGLVAITAVLVRFVVLLTQGAAAVKEWIDGFNAWAESFSSASGSIVGAMEGLPGQLFQGGLAAGQSMIDGLVGGITAGVGRVQGAVSGLSSSISDRFTGFWGNNSPSKLTRGWGMDLGRGLAIGAETSTPMAANAIGAMGTPQSIASPTLDFSNLAGAIFSTAGGGGGGGGAQITVNINVSGAGPDAEEEWTRIAPRVRREIEVGLRTSGEV